MSHVPEIAVPAAATLGEGVCWDADRQYLYWVDILEKELHVHEPAAGSDRCIDVGQYIGAAVPHGSRRTAPRLAPRLPSARPGD